MQASVTFIGPSQDRYNFLDRVFGVRIFDINVAPTSPIPYNLYCSYSRAPFEPFDPNTNPEIPDEPPTFPDSTMSSERRNWVLWPLSYDISEVSGSGAAPMAYLGDCVHSLCPVLITINYGTLIGQVVDSGSGFSDPIQHIPLNCDKLQQCAQLVDPFSFVNVEFPNWDISVHPVQNRAWYFVYSDDSSRPLKRDEDPGDTFVAGTWSFTHFQTRAYNFERHLSVVGTTNKKSICGFPPESLLYLGSEPSLNIVSPGNQAYNVRHNFAISLKVLPKLNPDTESEIVGLWNHGLSDVPDGKRHWLPIARKGVALPLTSPTNDLDRPHAIIDILPKLFTDDCPSS